MSDRQGDTGGVWQGVDSGNRAQAIPGYCWSQSTITHILRPVLTIPPHWDLTSCKEMSHNLFLNTSIITFKACSRCDPIHWLNWDNQDRNWFYDLNQRKTHTQKKKNRLVCTVNCDINSRHLNPLDSRKCTPTSTRMVQNQIKSSSSE